MARTRLSIGELANPFFKLVFNEARTPDLFHRFETIH